MSKFDVKVEWSSGPSFDVAASAGPAVEVAPPPEFGGPEGKWSPEDLLVAAVSSCLTATFFYFSNRMKIDVATYSAEAGGTVEKTSDGLRFSEVNVTMRIGLKNGEQVEQVEGLEARLEQFCPVSQALKCPVHLKLDVTAA